jgi:hypothetical protein
MPRERYVTAMPTPDGALGAVSEASLAYSGAKGA